MIFAVSMFRNEQDICEAVIRHLFAEGVDRAIVADNMSTDGTRWRLDQLAQEFPLEVITDGEAAYYQSEKMTWLARNAYDQGAEWVIPFDADEVWYAPDHESIPEALYDCEHDVCVCQGWDHIARRDDPAGHPFKTMVYRKPDPQPFPKVCFRAHPDAVVAQGNHGVRRPGTVGPGPLEYRHFQYRTYTQFRDKVRHGKLAYELTDLPKSEGAHWRHAGAKPYNELREEWDALSDTEGLVYDPAPLMCG